MEIPVYHTVAHIIKLVTTSLDFICLMFFVKFNILKIHFLVVHPPELCVFVI